MVARMSQRDGLATIGDAGPDVFGAFLLEDRMGDAIWKLNPRVAFGRWELHHDGAVKASLTHIYTGCWSVTSHADRLTWSFPTAEAAAECVCLHLGLPVDTPIEARS